jgi:hypothetical protein
MELRIDRRLVVRGGVLGVLSGPLAAFPRQAPGAPPIPRVRRPTRDEQRRKLAAECEASGQWVFCETAHYFLVVQAPRADEPRGARRVSKAEHEAFVAELQVRVESLRRAVRGVFPREDGDPNPIESAPCVVRVCRDRSAYHSYGGPAGSTGYWNPEAVELAIFDSASAPPAAGQRDVRHTTWRALNSMLYFAYLAEFGTPVPPPWFHEGHAQYFAGFEFVAGEHVAAPEDYMRKRSAKKPPTLQAAQLVERFSKCDPKALEEYERGDHAPLGWALVWSLRQAPSTEGMARAGALERWWSAWLRTRDGAAANEAAFGGVDWRELDELCARALK